MSETIINGIDVSEYFIEVVDEGGSTIDYKLLPNSERLLVEKIFNQNQQLKRLQEENKRLQILSCANCGEKYLSPDGAELYEKNVLLQKENEELKEKIHFKNLYKLSGKCFFDAARQCNYFDDFVKARQALEKIRNEADRLLYEENPIYGYNNSNYFEILAKYVLAKTKEVLNDRN